MQLMIINREEDSFGAWFQNVLCDMLADLLHML